MGRPGRTKAKDEAGWKRSVNRHQVQSKDAASRQEKTIETRARRAGKKEIESYLKCPHCGVDWDLCPRKHLL